jgi:hypothetical protein
MRTIYTTLFLVTVCSLFAARGATNDVLAASEYAPAEAVFQLFLPMPPLPPKQGWRTNLVYCLTYGRSNSSLPADFMARFSAIPYRVITGTNALIFGASGAIIERASGRQAVVLALRGLDIKADRADASIRWIDSARTVAQVVHFVKKDGDWKYVDMFSTSAPSRWSP